MAIPRALTELWEGPLTAIKVSKTKSQKRRPEDNESCRAEQGMFPLQTCVVRTLFGGTADCDANTMHGIRSLKRITHELHSYEGHTQAERRHTVGWTVP